MRSDTSSEEVERFGWVRRSNIQEAACLTFVRGTEAERVATAFGAVPDKVQRFDFDELCEESFALHETYSMIGVRSIGDWLLVVEDNGHQGSRPEVLRRVSRGTEVTSAFWNVNSLTRFSHAVDGEIRTSFEALMPEYRHGTRPDALEDVRAGLPWSGLEDKGADTISLMLALSARITGGALTRDCFDGVFLTYPVAAWPDDLPTAADVLEEQVAEQYSGELVAALRTADARECHKAAVAVARFVLERVDWLHQPVIAETLAAVGTGRFVQAAAISHSVREWTWQLQTNRATSKVRNQARASEVLRQATNIDPYVAALATLDKAKLIGGIEEGELAGAALGALRSAQ